MPERTLSIKVIPNSKIDKLVAQKGDALRIKLVAPAVDNKANFALIKFLSSHFKIAKNKINILSGAKSRQKKVKIILP
jgi:hypothetical protein